MKFNKEHDCWVSKDGIVCVLRGPSNQFGYHGDYGMLPVARKYHKYEWVHGAYVHRLVWETFNGPVPEGMEIDHINRDKHDNRLSNLRLVSHRENCNNRTYIKPWSLNPKPDGYRYKSCKGNWACNHCGEVFAGIHDLYKHKHETGHLGKK